MKKAWLVFPLTATIIATGIVWWENRLPASTPREEVRMSGISREDLLRLGFRPEVNGGGFRHARISVGTLMTELGFRSEQIQPLPNYSPGFPIVHAQFASGCCQLTYSEWLWTGANGGQPVGMNWTNDGPEKPFPNPIGRVRNLGDGDNYVEALVWFYNGLGR